MIDQTFANLLPYFIGIYDFKLRSIAFEQTCLLQMYYLLPGINDDLFIHSITHCVPVQIECDGNIENLI